MAKKLKMGKKSLTEFYPDYLRGLINSTEKLGKLLWYYYGGTKNKVMRDFSKKVIFIGKSEDLFQRIGLHCVIEDRKLALAAMFDKKNGELLKDLIIELLGLSQMSGIDIEDILIEADKKDVIYWKK